MYPHRIRLRGPWQALIEGQPPAPIQLPGEWDGHANMAGTSEMQLLRRFGRPRIIDEDEQVFIVCRYRSDVVATLNGTPLKDGNRFNEQVEWLVTSIIQPRNDFLVSLPIQSTLDPPDFAIEICGPVFLRNVQISRNAISGLVMGDSRPNLEVHLLRNGRLDTTVSGQAGQHFTFTLSQPAGDDYGDLHSPRWSVELIEAANRWYLVEEHSMAKCLPG